MAGRPKTRARNRSINGNRLKAPTYPALAAIYAEKWNTFDALRAAMVQSGIVEHGISPYDCIQRAIDDVTTDYLLLRRKIDKESSTIEQAIEHPLQSHCEHLRECMVRYSTFAAQYDINNKNIKLSEARLALLSNGLKEVARSLRLDEGQTKQLPQMLINIFSQSQKLDETKTYALAEIMGNDAEIEIIDGDAEEITPNSVKNAKENFQKPKHQRQIEGQKRANSRTKKVKELHEDVATAKLGKNTRATQA